MPTNKTPASWSLTPGSYSVDDGGDTFGRYATSDACRERNRIYHQKNRNHRNERKKKHDRSHKKKEYERWRRQTPKRIQYLIEYDKKHYIENREKILAQWKAYQQTERGKESHRERNRRYYLKNRGKIREQNRDYYLRKKLERESNKV